MIPETRIFQVEWRVLRALNGWQLKAYILLRNTEAPMTCADIAEALETEPRNIWLALTHLVERCYLVKKAGKYEIAHFQGTPLADSQIHEQDSQNHEQNSQIHEQNSQIHEQNSQNHEQNSQNHEQNSQKHVDNSQIHEHFTQIHEEKFPHTPLKENSTHSGVEVESPAPAPARPREDFDFISLLTDDDSLRPYAEEFLRGLRQQGISPEKKGPADLRDHFNNWLPKFQAKQEIAAKSKNCPTEVVLNSSPKMKGLSRTASGGVSSAPDERAGGSFRTPYKGLAEGLRSMDNHNAQPSLLSPVQLQAQLLSKRQREQQAAELQRQLDAQQSEAAQAEDVKAAFFAKFGKPPKK